VYVVLRGHSRTLAQATVLQVDDPKVEPEPVGVELVVTPEAAEYIGDKSGRLYVWPRSALLGLCSPAQDHSDGDGNPRVEESQNGELHQP
jgi:hypothetical protein